MELSIANVAGLKTFLEVTLPGKTHEISQLSENTEIQIETANDIYWINWDHLALFGTFVRIDNRKAMRI